MVCVRSEALLNGEMKRKAMLSDYDGGGEIHRATRKMSMRFQLGQYLRLSGSN